MSRKQRVQNLLDAHYPGASIDVIDETHGHNVPKDGETHLRLRVVWEGFEGVNRVKRQRAVQKLMQAEFDTGLHALALELRTPAEWSKLGAVEPPPCKGGAKREA